MKKITLAAVAAALGVPDVLRRLFAPTRWAKDKASRSRSHTGNGPREVERRKRQLARGTIKAG